MSDQAPDPANPTVASTASTATGVWKSAGVWMSAVGQKAKHAATVAGERFDKAAVSVGQTVDKVSNQLGEAYETRIARETAAANEQREQHRRALELPFTDQRQAELFEHGNSLVSECLTLVGDLHAELQYATEENPLGRESYGLMMLVNMMVPMLELGLRPDWKSILPAASFIGDSSQWMQNVANNVRHSSPSAFAMLQAADQGWNAAPGAGLGVSDVNMKDITSNEHKLQAWVFDSFNKGLLGQRLNTLLQQKSLLKDWMYPWAVLLHDELFLDLLAELVKVDSQSAMINLPLSQLQNHSAARGGDRAVMANWSEKMKESFSAASSAALRGSKAALAKASEYSQKVSEGIRSANTPRSTTYATSDPDDDGAGTPAAQAAAVKRSDTGESARGSTSGQAMSLHVNDVFGADDQEPDAAVHGLQSMHAPASIDDQSEDGRHEVPRASVTAVTAAVGNVTLDSDPAGP